MYETKRFKTYKPNNTFGLFGNSNPFGNNNNNKPGGLFGNNNNVGGLFGNFP